MWNNEHLSRGTVKCWLEKIPFKVWILLILYEQSSIDSIKPFFIKWSLIKLNLEVVKCKVII